MAPLVPAFLKIEGVHFPLQATAGSVGIASGIEELQALRFALDQLVNGDARTMSIDQFLRDGFHVQELSLMPVDPAMQTRWLADGPINWRWLSGRWADLTGAFLAWAGFIERALVVPGPVVLELVTRLRALREDILAGTREGRVDDTPVPPPPPRTPEIEEHDRLREQSLAEAQAYREELYARRG